MASTSPSPATDEAAGGGFALAARLTLLDLALLPVGQGWLRAAVLVPAVAGLALPGWLRRAELWLALALLLVWRVVDDWPLPDNHAYLLSAWCLALGLCRALPRGEAVLAWNARWLLALCFGFATLWKLASPDYLDGSFFQVTLLRDPRFEGIATLAGGLTPELLELHREALGAPPGALEPPALPERFFRLARLATLATVALEAAVALAFLWPLGRGLSRARHALLLLFCATTYAVAPVEGFGWLLVAMGAAQCEPRQRATRALYVGAFLLILFYREVDWAAWLAARLGAS